MKKLNRKPDGYLASPKAGNGSGIIVLHAWWGLTPFFRQVCDRLATAGYVAFAPDYYRGSTATTIEQAKRLRSKINRKAVEDSVKNAVAFLIEQPDLSRPKVGTLGFSLGASFALGLARAEPERAAAVVVFYGTGGGKFNKARAAFQGHFAENDAWGAGPDKAHALQQRLRAAGRTAEFYSYPDTQHWFFEEDNPAYHPSAARLAWERTITFLNKHLAA